MTSVTDVGVGDITFTFDTDFSDQSNYAGVAMAEYTKGLINGISNAQGAGSMRFRNYTGAIPAVVDPITTWNFIGVGDQA